MLKSRRGKGLLLAEIVREWAEEWHAKRQTQGASITASRFRRAAITIEALQQELADTKRDRNAIEKSYRYWAVRALSAETALERCKQEAGTTCPKCQGRRVIPDGAHHSGLGKDYGGRYCPECT